MKTIVSLLLAAATVTLAGPAAAQFAKPEDAVKYRKGAFTVLGSHFSRIGAMANGRVPFDAKAAAENAAIVESMSKLPWAAFGAGTDKGETRAKPEIWKEEAKFKQDADKMQAELAKLAVAAKTGNLDQMKAAFGPAANTCKSCHDSFRKE